MISEKNDILIDHDRPMCAEDALRAVTIYASLPDEVALTERAAASLRAYLVASGLGHYRIFFGCDHLYDLEASLDALGEVAAWEAVAPMSEGGEMIHAITHREDGKAMLWETGILRLARSEVVVGRWYWSHRDYHTHTRSLWLFAAPSVEHYSTLRARIHDERRKRGGAVWQIMRGGSDGEDMRTPRDGSAAHDIVIAPALRKRLDTDVIGFFGDDVAALYRALKVPYRRGVLLHGPPGNGKTSLIRYIGARLVHIPIMLLRPAAKFDTDDLEDVLRQWKEQAPAIFVIEDLDWLLKQVNVSTLLNLLDGVDSVAGGGLLLIATTNNPHELDPAINNRPGRFDVVIEIQPPDRAMRLELLRRKLPEIEPPTLQKLADMTEGLSFAHVLEILRLSGFTAIAAGRAMRTEGDLFDACETVKATNEDARRGFPQKLDVPFGIVHRRKAQS